ncbi:MAG: DUF3410 domain-containing protein [candidate division KSB1 bacterium]|nr:DUF3410 domain-containing protein [candidate division KSB1 bacterium]
MQNEKLRSEAILEKTIRHAYDIIADDRRLREGIKMNAEARRRYFDRLRRDYPMRREFHNYEVNLSASNSTAMAPLQALGFRVQVDCV